IIWSVLSTPVSLTNSIVGFCVCVTIWKLYADEEAVLPAISSTVKYSFTIQTEVVPPKAELDASDDSGAKGDWITNKHNALTL
ncbi:hypothetical protein, partial [Salmonella enterica]|uniref:hypothetical protein n=1 Tax=Salmonella enterica TaxID=28901 RepID=UPI001C3CBB02